MLTELNFQQLQKEFDENLKHQNKFYENYVLLFETLLLFIRAWRQQLWELNLQSLHCLCPYFSVFDMLNYARLTPVYLSQLYQLRNDGPTIWDRFVEGEFSVNKSNVPFSAIGADHALEQENRVVKVLGGIKGIANSQQFCASFLLEDSDARKREQHYQLIGSKNSRLSTNVNKLLDVFNTQGITFEESDEVYNVLTKKVLATDVAEAFLSMRGAGNAKYCEFVSENLLGSKSIWDTIKKKKLPTFAKNCTQTKLTIDKQLVNIKEERKPMSRVVIAARTRPETDLPAYFGSYEFSVVPKSLFATDGCLRLSTDKASIAQEILKLQQQECNQSTESVNESTESNIRKVIIFDGMAVVNRKSKKTSKKRK